MPDENPAPPPVTSADHIAVAKRSLQLGVNVDRAIAHALVAIAQQGEPINVVVETDEPSDPTPRMWTAVFEATTDPDEARYVTVDQPGGGPAGRKLFVRHHSEAALFVPGEYDLMAARAAIAELIFSIKHGNLEPTIEVVNQIVKGAVLAMRWRPPQ